MLCYGLVNLREWALAQGIHPQTAYRWYREGKLPVPARKMGKLILVGDLAKSAAPGPHHTVVYARVSSADQRTDLDRQVARVVSWATEHGYSVDQVVTEVGSALNGHRRKFLSLLRDKEVDTILVEHRDRFCRFGAEYVEAALEAQGRRLVVVDPSELDDDLVRDATELLTSLCARLYGRRSAANRARRAVEVACGEAVA
jgi:putative resolvase